MNFLALLPEILRLVPVITSAINSGINFKTAMGVISNPDVLNVFQQLGARLFPKAAPELQAVAAIVSSYSPDYVKWVQNSLNALTAHKVAVDGAYGPQTRSAVEALQAQLGLVVDGYAGDITSAAIQTALNKLTTK